MDSEKLTGYIPDGENLPGYKKKSFALNYNGGEIWFEHLDGIYGCDGLTVKKLTVDVPKFTRPSSPSFTCFAFDETAVTDAVFDSVRYALLDSGKRFMKAAFCGLERKNTVKFRKAFTGRGFAVAFFDDIEDAKIRLSHRNKAG